MPVNVLGGSANVAEALIDERTAVLVTNEIPPEIVAAGRDAPAALQTATYSTYVVSKLFFFYMVGQRVTDDRGTLGRFQ